MAPKIKDSARNHKGRVTESRRTMQGNTNARVVRWWKSAKKDMASDLISTAVYLKSNQQFRYRQASLFTRLYGNNPLFGLGGVHQKTLQSNALPYDRPTMNVIQSCVDTLGSRLTQARPRPVFLTDAGDYKARSLGKQMNDFIQGEFHSKEVDAYELGPLILRDAAVLGTGVVKVYAKDGKMCAERVLCTELFVDPNDAMYGKPRQLYQMYLIDREVLMDYFSEEGKKKIIEKAEQAYPTQMPENTETVSDQVLVVEGWRLPSSEDAKDGKHCIAVSSGLLVDEQWDKCNFPFVFLHHTPRLTGFFGQSLAEQLMGTQMEINKLLVTISRSINLMGVPRIFVEDGSKVAKQHFNNDIGSIITYRGRMPEERNFQSNHPEIYAQLQRLIEYAYQQSGISALAAAAKKPEGLNAGVALREYDDLQSDRFAALSKRYENFFVDLAYQLIDGAREVAEQTGEYATVYPARDGTRQINLPKFDIVDDTFVIQCFSASALPKDPAGRMQKITELIQAGMIDIREGRRLLDYPDLDQNEKLANASEERILQTLDKIVEDGEYTPPDEFMDLELAKRLSVQYYNLYVAANLEPNKAGMLQTFNTQAQTLIEAAQMAAMPQQAAPGPGAQPLAEPEPVPTTPLLPQTVSG